ncbi:uncharacterized protein B0H18DRAFT_254759 [Fomitopsis serialis]|uniref:uncharacterized protein n=1 Tax=Fomitopsis serialis TaxID=139415 RepID=UPI002007C839|nr:uncharacterized protein B0H18DRAFT_254759 [Neoantrodia serialis]KAH9928332.1 hypothetical protein B0H18DRAFT_254759 [Neoantrodia serialis]
MQRQHQPESEGLTLYLSTDSPRDTTLTDSSGQVLYDVHTECDNGTFTTHVSEGDVDLKAVEVARLRWTGVNLHAGTVTVAFREGQTLPVREWLCKSKMPFNKDSVTFVDGEGRKYKWKRYELYCEDDDYKQSIAAFHKSSVDESAKPPAPKEIRAMLKLSPRAEQVDDQVVCSFLFTEIERRMKEGYLRDGDVRARVSASSGYMNSGGSFGLLTATSTVM